MSDRKIINKYFPIDFDPAKLPRRKKAKNDQTKVRMALPMSIRCSHCSNFMARNTKFNARKETVAEKTYLDITAYRLYFRCSRCFAEITIRTDPEVSDYACEKGATRSYELHKEEAAKEEASRLERDELEAGNTMKLLEDKSLESKMEIEVSEAIDAIFWLQSKRHEVSSDELIEMALRASRAKSGTESLNEEGLSKEDLLELEKVKFRAHPTVDASVGTSTRENESPSDEPAIQEDTKRYIKRLNDDDDKETPLEIRTKLAIEKMASKSKLLQLQQPVESPSVSPVQQPLGDRGRESDPTRTKSIIQSGSVCIQVKPKVSPCTSPPGEGFMLPPKSSSKKSIGLVSCYSRQEDEE